MDIGLANIVRGSGFNFKFQYNDGTQNFDHVIYKFAIDGDLPEESRKSVAQRIINALQTAKFNFDHAGFEKLQRGKGPEYWAFAIRVPVPFPDKALDRDEHGNLIFTRPRRRRVDYSGLK